MNDFRRLSETVLASPQIVLDDIAAAKAQGVTLIVNNRPEGEAEDQTEAATFLIAAMQQRVDAILAI